MTITRDDLHELADLLADLIEQRQAAPSAPVAKPTPKAKAPRRKATPAPPTVGTAIEVSEANRARARDALLRRGMFLPPRGQNDDERRTANSRSK